MKWNLAFRVGFLIILNTCISVVYAKNLFNVSFMKDRSGPGGYVTVRTTTPNFRYGLAGMQIISPNYVFSNDNAACTRNASNGWCMFSVSDEHAVVFKVSQTNTLGPVNASDNKITIRLSPNAQKTPFTVHEITKTAQSSGRIIGYLYGWEVPPAASAIAAAGYTHVLIAFGLLSTTSPGQINLDAISGFDLQSYVQSLHQSGLKVLLSIGGASTNIPNTTVDFDHAVSLASSPAAFETAFTSALASLTTTYAFDGFDFDIESGLNSASSFTNPGLGCSNSTYSSSCDIFYLSTIINDFHTQSPNSMLTMAPQIANMSATQQFTSIWGNYASLIMQTHASLEWVGFQNYNAGCAYGIDLVCYPTGANTLTSTADPAVAFATDLLANWPSITPSGQVTGFLPYTSYLTPSQAVIGYVVSNASGQTDGAPSVSPNLPVVNHAIQCLRTGELCDTYTPPTTYPSIGGVFSWTINYDATTNYQFATTLYPCVIQGNC